MTQDKVHILIVDDRPQNLMALEATLADMGLNIVKAGSGREALRHVLRQNFAVILLDVQMPDMDGFETAELIRQRKQSEHTPIIFVTANSSDEMHFVRGYSLGAVDYIPKPFKPEILRSKIAVFVELFRKSTEVQRQAERLAQINQKLEEEIAERMRAEEKIRESESRFRAMFENAGIGVSLGSLSGKFIKANPALEQLLGFSSDELCRFAFTELVHPEDQQQVHELYQSLCRGDREQYVTENRYVRRNGEIIWAKSVVSIVKNSEGKPIYTVCMTEDVTSQKANTEQLERLTRELAKSNDELTRAKETAERANRAKTVFLSNMSHELRTPLNAILGFAQILKKDLAIPEPQRGFLDTMYRSGTHLLEMINDVLDNSKIESGNMELHPQDFNLHVLLDELGDMFTLRAREKGIALFVDYDKNTPKFVYADAKRLRQILINLLGNAVKFTSSGEISLSVKSGRSQLIDGKVCSRIRFIVRDTGRGIAPDDLQSIFEPFRQSTSIYSEGSGLGLAISRRIARLMDGEIYVESQEGVGSVFTLDLQLQVTLIGEQDLKSPYADAGYPGKKPNILIVDRRGSKRRRIRVVLEESGYLCTDAENIRVAQELSLLNPPDLVIAQATALNSGQHRPNGLPKLECPILAVCSGKNQGRFVNADDCIPEPVNPEELINKVSSLIQSRSCEQTEDHKTLPDAMANGENKIRKIVREIRALPESHSELLCEAIEVQDFDKIQTTLGEIDGLKNGDFSGLHELLQAASQAQYRFLFQLTEELRNELNV